MRNLKFDFSLQILLFLLLSIYSFAQTGISQTLSPLNLKSPVEGQITEGGTQAFALHLEGNQIADIVLEQIDAKLKIVITDAKTEETLIDLNLNYDNFGKERVLFQSADQPRDLIVKVVRFSKDNGKGNFKLTLAELKAADATDKLRIAAQSSILEGKKKSSKEAVSYYENALKLARESGDADLEIETLINLQRTSSSAGDYKKIAEYGNRAITLLKGDEISYEKIRVESMIGYALTNMGEPKRAVELLSETALKAHKLGDRSQEAYILQNLGNAYQLTGNSTKALECAEESYKIAESNGDKSNQTYALRIMAFAYYDQGDFLKAIEVLNRALILGQESGNTTIVLSIYNELGRDYVGLGQLQKALDYYQLSLAGKRKLNGNKYNEAISIVSIARIYSTLGQSSRAIDYNREAVRIFSEVGYKDATVNGMYANGTIYLSLGDYEKAKETYLETLKLCGEDGFPLLQAQIYSSLGKVEKKLDHPEAAIGYLQKAIKLNADLKMKRLQAIPLITLADLYIKIGQFEKAAESANSALENARTTGDRVSESDALYNLAAARRGQNDLKAALGFIEDSLKIIESLRSTFINQESRTAYFSTVRDKYDFYIQLLIELKNEPGNEKYGAQAFATSEKSRARSLLDLLAESYTDVSEGVSPELKLREQSVQAKLSALQTQLIRAKSAEKPDDALIARLQKDIDRTDDEREQLESEIRRTNPRYAALKYPTTLDLAQTQNLLDEKTILLEYQTGANASFLFAVSKNDFQIFRLPKEQNLRETIESLRRSISVPTRTGYANYLVAGRALYQTLLAPIESLLKTKNKIIIAADGSLNYLPFEVLLRNNAETNLNKLPYLVRDFEISYTPSASVLANLGTQENALTTKPAKSFLAFAAPDYGAKTANQNQLVSQNTRAVFAESRSWDLTDLPNAAVEAERIAKLFPAGQSTVFSGAQATEEQAKTKELLSQYRYLHFAVHGLIDEEQPQFSSLVLSLPKFAAKDSSAENPKSEIQNPKLIEDGLLQTPEIFNLRLRTDLVTLSACETGLGKEMRGEGIVGLTRAFFYAGTPSVLVSLWKVNDASTADLMTQFYEQLRKDNGQNKAAALRQAQLKIIAGNRYAHPYYWAPFILQGKPNSSIGIK